MNIFDPVRNPLIIPEQEERKKGCPVCGHEDFNGRRIQGVVLFTCASPTCKAQWGGGLPQEPMDPRMPRPPEDPLSQPPVAFSRDPRTGQIIENRRSVSTTPEFRKGALIPSPGEEDDV